MEKNKKTIILIVILLLVVVFGISAYIIFNEKKGDDKDSTKVVLSLSGATQAEIDNEIKTNLENNKYTLENAAVYSNPYKSSPLSAMITFYTDKKVGVKCVIKGKNNNDIVLNYETKENYHYIPVYGLYDNYENIILIETSDGKENEFKIKTDKLEVSDRINKVIANTSDNNLYFITTPIPMSTYAFDGNGELRWSINGEYYHGVEPLENGHILIGTNTMNKYGLSTELVEMDLLGRIYNRYSLENGYLNNFYVKENGNILLASKSSDRETYSDLIVEIDKNTGKIIKSTDIYEMFKNIDFNFTTGLNDAYFYNSGIQYNEKTDELLLTYWGGEFVINLDYSDSKINWIFSNPENFTSAFDSYLLKSNDGVYPKSMHSATLDGNILKVLDNGYSTNKGEISVPKLNGSYSSANTYEILDKTITYKSTYDENKEHFSYALGDYEITKDSEIILYGRELKNIDYNVEQDINQYIDLETKIIEYRDNKKIMELSLNHAAYSVTKINLNNKYKFEFIDEKLLTTINPIKGDLLTEEMIDMVRSTKETANYNFGYSLGFLEHDSMFMNSDEAKIILINNNNEGSVYTLKEKDKTQINQILIDIPKDKYNLYIILNGICYDINQHIEVK